MPPNPVRPPSSGRSSESVALSTPGSDRVRSSNSRTNGRAVSPPVSGERQVELDDIDAAFVEAGRDRCGMLQRTQEQARHDDQHQRHRHLPDDEDVPQSHTRAAGIESFRLQRGYEISARGLQGRRQAREDGRQERDRDPERDDAPVSMNGEVDRNGQFRDDGQHQRRQPVRQHQAGEAPRQRTG